MLIVFKYYLARNPWTVDSVIQFGCGCALSYPFTDPSAWEPNIKDLPDPPGLGKATDAPDGITTVAVSSGDNGGGVATNNDVLLAAALAPGCEAIASVNKDLTSSAVANSRGVCPSWFRRKGSAPWAN